MEKDKLKIISIIPARGGSKSIPRKNIKLLAGKPLLAYSIEQSLNSKLVDRTIVSTDDKEIADIAKKYGAEVIERPAELATDTARTEPVLQHVVNLLESKGEHIDIIVLLQPTSPLREKEDIDNAINTLLKIKADSLVSVYDFYPYFLWDKKGDIGIPTNYDPQHRPIKQEKKFYRENGSIYVIKRDILMKQNCRLGGKIALYIMNESSSMDIDTEFDFWIIEQFIRKRKVYK